MEISTAQADVRRVYRGGATGPLVSGLIWFAAAAVAQWGSPDVAMAVLFFGGMLIFPLSTLLLKALGGPAGLPKGHPANGLAMQSAFTVPIGMLLAIALGRTNPELFFAATMILVGAHYLTFISLYGMRHYAVLAAALVLAGAAAIFWLPQLRPLAGWIGGAILLLAVVPLWLGGREGRDAARQRAPEPSGEQ